VLRGLQEARCPELIHDITTIAMLRYTILSTKPDVVAPIIDLTNVRVLAAMLGTNVPVIACEQTDARRISLRGLQGAREALYRRAAAVVAPDPVIAQWLAARGASARAIPNPLVAPPARPVTRTGTRRRLVTLARLSAEKRAEFLVRSFASISANYPEWNLEIYGVGPQQNSLEHLVEQLVPPGRIRFCGFSTNPYDVLADADLFVSASWVEGFGNAIWEALACGVPVVAMDAGPAVRSLVRDEVDGLIVKQNTMAALASALSQLMGDEAKRKACAARAAEILQRFSMESALEKWDALLAEVLP
jgi:glycosyltransferase involved in cell wall biosynthesis